MKTKALLITTVCIITTALLVTVIISYKGYNDTQVRVQRPEEKELKYIEDIAADNDSSLINSYITHAQIDGYIMKCIGNNLNVYEVYNNGHRELIQTVSINMAVLPDEDKRQLEQGISTDSYDKICSMIEDFSS